MRQFFKRHVAGLAVVGLVLPILAACGQAQPQVIRETVVSVQTAPPQVIRETVVATPEGGAPAAAGAYTTPHPIIGWTPEGLKVRQAIAHCTNRPELIKSVYPFLSEEDQQKLLMDANLPQGHWALATTGLTTYPFDVERGKALLDEAGWTLAEGQSVRAKDGVPMSLSFTTTNAQFRQTWSQVFIQQMSECGIQIIPTYAPGSWWFGSTTGLRRRDFELGAFAWVGETDPGGQTLYACNQIPLPSNNWEGQNYMGWCNETASNAILAANNTLDREERIRQFAIFQAEFTKDMVSLPVFNRTEAGAWGTGLTGIDFNPTEYYTHNIAEWTLDGKDTAVIAFTQEPATMWSLIESAAVQQTAVRLLTASAFTTLDYDYQAKWLTELPTIDSGKAKNVEVDVKAGDQVWTAAGEAAELAADVAVTNAAGEAVTWDGTSPLKMNQLSVTFEYKPGIKWSDGEPLKKADFELGYKINCDPESGATSFTVCESIQSVEFTSDTSYTVTYKPGAQWPEYMIYTIGSYPSHQVIETEGASKGKTLAEVPAAEWKNLKEIVETPLSTGPYVLTSWQKGQSMTFEANPNYVGGAPNIPTVVIQFVADTQQAVAQLLTGAVDVVGTETLGAGAEVQTVLDAAAEGKVNAKTIASPTWEHIDFNLFVR
ncbi:MAG: ABC transporter substrate-binding protein [Chloroflexaceae bacterium]|jgi:ABC-type transport system substrate-binding protein|nr:ABC transporter substrate-binding protein [Chloroflexaceae bacterium]